MALARRGSDDKFCREEAGRSPGREIDRQTGEYHAFRRWTVVPDEEHEEPARQIAITDAPERGEGPCSAMRSEGCLPDVVDFGRIGAQTGQAGYAPLQKIRDAESRNKFLVIGAR
jgi:N utilization substance protein A